MKLKKSVIMDHINKVQRKGYYQAYAKYIIEQGRAYPCFATTEEAKRCVKRKLQQIRPGYYGIWAKCRNLISRRSGKKK